MPATNAASCAVRASTAVLELGLEESHLQGVRNLSHVLCAIDLGEESDSILQEADRIARRCGARLTVLHVLPDGFPGVAMSPAGSKESLLAQQEMSADVGGAIATKIANLTARSEGEVVVEVEAGTPHELIVERASEIGAELIVLGAGGKSPTSTRGRHLLGRVATHVTKKALADVLIVRRHRVSGPVIATVDFSDVSPSVARVAYGEAVARSAPFFLVHAIEPDLATLALGDTAMGASVIIPEELKAAALPRARARLAELAGQLPAPVETMVLDESPALALPAVAASTGADLVVVGVPHTSAFERFVSGGDATSDVIRSCHCSVLVTRASITNTGLPSRI